jgi:hypothetical protein
MTPERAHEIGKAMALKQGPGPENTEEAGQALGILWTQLNLARRIIEDLRDELEEREWTYLDGGWKGGEGVECRGCWVRGPRREPPEHRLTCAWKQAVDDANSFLGVRE